MVSPHAVGSPEHVWLRRSVDEGSTAWTCPCSYRAFRLLGTKIRNTKHVGVDDRITRLWVASSFAPFFNNGSEALTSWAHTPLAAIDLICWGAIIHRLATRRNLLRWSSVTQCAAMTWIRSVLSTVIKLWWVKSLSFNGWPL